jgi:hypothetical protein
MIASARPARMGSARTRSGWKVASLGRPRAIGWPQACLGLLAVSLICSGCSNWSFPGFKKSGGEQLKPRGRAYLEEVAVPEGFSKVADKSWDRQAGGQRMAEHEYRGSADALAVRDFYRQQMPQMGWERVSDQDDKGVITIRFEKYHEVCTVRIRQGELGRTVINVELGPFSRTSVEPPKRRS